MSESKTPRMDALQSDPLIANESTLEKGMRLIAIGRQLETELQAATIRAESTEDSLLEQMNINQQLGEELHAAKDKLSEWRTVFGDIADASAKWDAMSLQIAELCGIDNYLLAVDLDKAKAEIARLTSGIKEICNTCEMIKGERAISDRKECESQAAKVVASKAMHDYETAQTELYRERKSSCEIINGLRGEIAKRDKVIEKFIKADTEESGCQCGVCCESRREWVKEELGK